MTPVWLAVLGWRLLAYGLLSTLAVLLVLVWTRRGIKHPELRVLAWKLALIGPVLAVFLLAVIDPPRWGWRIGIPSATEGASDGSPSAGVWAAPGVGAGARSRPEPSAPFGGSSAAPTAAAGGDLAAPLAGERWGASMPPATPLAAWIAPASLSAACGWLAAAWLAGLVWAWGRVAARILQLRRWRLQATPVVSPELHAICQRVQQKLSLRRRVELLQCPLASGPLTAGVLRPFVMLPEDVDWTEDGQAEAVLAHELAHVVRGDAAWNLLAELICGSFMFQPLNRWARQRLRLEMDLVADSLAARDAFSRGQLARCLMQWSRRAGAADGRSPAIASLASSMAGFRSALGRRIESLLSREAPRRPGPWRRGAVWAVFLATLFASTSLLPLPSLPTHSSPVPGFADNPSRNPSMTRSTTTLALLAALSIPTPSLPVAAAQELKSVPDALPAGMRQFNGMLVGRLAAKDVEKGAFLVQVDAVPRVWRNSRAEDPKSVVGKTVEVSGVFGKFLDVLVVTRLGETVEFECKHDGDGLVFPGELLRKVAPYNPADYPELPEAFRGFHGAAAATILKKDPETFELIVRVDRILQVWDKSQAKSPEIMAGKPMMLAGFWNRKDAYYDLKVGDRIEAGMQHLGLRSDHLTVAEFVRPAADAPSASQDRGETPREQRGFRGMLVGRISAKDAERGEFTVTVDAVPRVWKNNQSPNPKALIGKQVAMEGVSGRMLDALIVARVGETIEFGALHEDGPRMRVGEVLRKVAPVKPGDYPELPEGFRGFRGMVTAKVIRKDEHLMDLTIEVLTIEEAFPASRAKVPESLVGGRAMLAGFWNRKDLFHELSVGDTIRCGVEHPQLLSDHLSVIESVKKLEAR